MENCLVNQLKAKVDNDNLPYLDAKIIILTGIDNSGFNLVQASKGILLTGNLYSDSAATTVAKQAGDTVDSSYYYLKEEETVKLRLNYKDVDLIQIQSPSLSCPISDFGFFGKLTNLYLRFTGVYGTLERFIERLCSAKENTDNLYLIISDTAVTINNQIPVSVDMFVVNWNNGVVSVCNYQDQSEVFATYTIATGEWSYPT